MGRKNIKNSCVYNFKGICELNTCNHYRKHCHYVCNNFISKSNKPSKPNEKTYKQLINNPRFSIKFIKKDGCLLLKIIISIVYSKFHRSKDGSYNYFFKSYQENEKLEISISLVNAESMILFLFSDFYKGITVESSTLYITLDDLPEITNNCTPYRKLPNMIVISKIIKNESGQIDIRLMLSKGLLFSLIDELVRKDPASNMVKPKVKVLKSKKQRNDVNINMNQRSKEVSSTALLNCEVIQSHQGRSIIITGIVISDNRKCTYNNHVIYDVLAKANVVTPNGKIILVTIPTAYCDVCNKYIVLKQDFLKAKEQGVLLCSVEDKTARYIQKHVNQKYKSIGESRIHKMGYNVRKDVGYTDMQRHVILANILENTNISHHEILSVIDAGIARHKSKLTHQHAIQCWISDRKFITSYKTGDMPEVLIDKIVLKKRSTNYMNLTNEIAKLVWNIK